jgi:hypothetical protein
MEPERAVTADAVAAAASSLAEMMIKLANKKIMALSRSKKFKQVFLRPLASAIGRLTANILPCKPCLLRATEEGWTRAT